MDQHIAPTLQVWQNFYFMLGSCAGALTGLQFIVITLVAQARAAGSMSDIRAFGTPTVAHFVSVLIISAVMLVPLPMLAPLAILLCMCGVLGEMYCIGAIWHSRHASYQPDMEDRVWYSGLPAIAHLALISFAVLLWLDRRWALFGVAGVALLLLILGIRNSWDTMTYIVVRHTNEVSKKDD